MIENSSFENTSELDSNTMKADQRHSLEGMMGMGVASTFHAILMQSSPKIFQVRASIKKCYSVNHGSWYGIIHTGMQLRKSQAGLFICQAGFFTQIHLQSNPMSLFS